MKITHLNLILILTALLFFGCGGDNGSTDIDKYNESIDIGGSGPPDGEFVTFPDLVFPEIMYYGANLSYFPPDAMEWIINTGFPKENMEMPGMLNSSLKVWWSEDNNTILFEASYTVASGYVGAGKVKTWGQEAYYSGPSTIVEMYGKYSYYHTLRFKYEHKLYVENLLKTDSAFAEVIKFAKEQSAEIEYDWSNFDGYLGAPVVRTPGKKYAVCDGYANEVIEKALELSCVKTVQKWTSTGHAWNVLKLVDGRTLYFDLTWFDNEHINSETGKIYQTDDYDWENITFFKHLFSFSNVGYGTKVFHHNIGEFHSEKSKE